MPATHAAVSVLAVAATVVLVGSAGAEIRIVAFGDSGTYGSGVSSATGQTGGVPKSKAYPAILEQKLRAKGWDVRVVNEGVPGDLASTAIGRVRSAVPEGTAVTIIELGGNDLRRGVSPADVRASIATIVKAVGERKSVPMVAAGQQAGSFVYPWLSGFWDPVTHYPVPKYDSGDKEHLNEAGNAALAARMMPDVERILVKLGFRPGP